MSIRRRGARIAGSHAVLLALTVVSLAAAATLRPILATRRIYDYVFTFDITQSANVVDSRLNGVPVSRLTFAKAAGRAALRALPCGSRVGWSVFTDYRQMSLLAPLEVCAHYEALIASLEGIDGRMRWANASNIGRGLYGSLRAAQSIGPHTAVVFLTDGQEAPPVAAGESAMPDIPPDSFGGILVGLGGDVPSPIPKITADGQVAGYWRADEVVQRADEPPGRSHEELSRLDESHLRDLAEHAAMRYVRLESIPAFANGLRQERYAHRDKVLTDLRWIPATLALCSMCWIFLPSWGRRRSANPV